VSRLYYGDFDEFFDRIEEGGHFAHHEMNDDQFEWLEAIWDEYNDEGYIDWDDKSADSAWYMYVTEVLGYEHEEIEKYMS